MSRLTIDQYSALNSYRSSCSTCRPYSRREFVEPLTTLNRSRPPKRLSKLSAILARSVGEIRPGWTASSGLKRVLVEAASAEPSGHTS
ncbi:hypothetical protein STANM309S_04170 [Streptomyces tanashiensis]